MLSPASSAPSWLVRPDVPRPFAEVIGDPVAQSKSPTIHSSWLEQLAIQADYRATRVRPDGLADFIARRRSNGFWRGCNVTIPHKQRIVGLLDELDPGARSIGAVNCVVSAKAGLIGYNTDIDGIAAALGPADLEGGKAVVIGAGGAARAALAYLAARHIGRIVLLVRDPNKARASLGWARPDSLEIRPLDRCDGAICGAAAIINASPLGMAGSPPMPDRLLELVAGEHGAATIFDMVTTPAETPFLIAGRAGSMRVVDGLTMLIGQARRAFELFFGEPPPADPGLRDLLSTDPAESLPRNQNGIPKR